MKSEQIIKRSIIINADKAAVWDALTNPEKTKKYMFNTEVHSDWKVGSKIKWEGEYEGYQSAEQGIILECELYKCLKYTSFDPNFGLEDVPENYLQISYELGGKEKETELLINIINFNGDSERIKNITGHWDTIIIPKFQKLFKK